MSSTSPPPTASLGSSLVPFVLGGPYTSCQPGWDWANNTLKQNPCEIAGVLEAACQGYSIYVLNQLLPGYNYVTPQRNSSGANCECNTVMYNLFMACTACQGQTIQSWDFWNQNCDEQYATLPNVPPGTAVPHWAYLMDHSFASDLAMSAGDSPESSPTSTAVSVSSTAVSVSSTAVSVSSTAVSVSSTAVSVSSTSSPNATSSYNSSIWSSSSVTSTLSGTSLRPTGSASATLSIIQSSSPSIPAPRLNKGVIAGSVLGGVAFIAGLIIFYRIRRHGKSTSGPHSASYEVDMPNPEMTVYNPSDPATFPQKDSTASFQAEYSRPVNTDALLLLRGQYTGAPEV